MMACVEAVDNVLFIDKSCIKICDVIGKGGYALQVFSASLTLPSGEVCRAAAKKVRSIDVKEIEVMKNLKHKNIIRFYGVVLDEPDAYIIMELAENGNVRHYLDEFRSENKTRLPLKVVWKWVYEGALGICCLHAKNYSHCDIKSLNFLITKDLTVKLGDLGLAKELDLTQDTTRVAGTCRWMAPEVIREQRRSPKSDVFSYGTVVWEIFTTEFPFAEKCGEFHVMSAVCTGQRPDIPDDCPQQLKELIQLCWKDDHNLRPNMDEICVQLEKCMQQGDQDTDELSAQLQQTALDGMQQGDQDTDELSAQLQQTALDDEIMETVAEQQAEPTSQEPPPGIDAGSPGGSPSSGSLLMYKMCSVPRGVCLIVNNMDFSQAREQGHKQLHDREGSDVDSKKLHDIFTKFKFDVRIKTNLSSEAMIECLDGIRRQDHTSANAFICCILTHGKDGQLAGCEGKYVTIQGIVNKFTKEECPSLEKKPKIFFIQACQSTESVEKQDFQANVGMMPSAGISGEFNLPGLEGDFLISIASICGLSPHKHSQLSSWYVDVLVDKLNELHEEEHLMNIMEEVNSTVDKKSVTSLRDLRMDLLSTLHKKLYFTMWESAQKNKQSKSITQATCELDFQGGTLSLPEIGASLDVPEGALPKNISVVKMSLSLHQDLEDHPPIDADHMMITPIICCGPKGVEFNKPVTLTLPHSVPSFKGIDFEPCDGKDIHLWFKSRKEKWQQLPSKIPEGKKQPFWLKAITHNTVQVEVKHFCNFGLSASKPQKMKILMFIQPSKIVPETRAAYVSAYAVQESLTEVIKLKEKRAHASVMCARENIFEVQPNQKELAITLKEILPDTGWEPTSEAKKIAYNKLKNGDEGSSCEFRFEKLVKTNPNTIMGQYKAEQEGNEYEITDSYFDIDMCRDINDNEQKTAVVPRREQGSEDLSLFPQSLAQKAEGIQPTSSVVEPTLVHKSESVNILQLIPKKETAIEKVQQIDEWRELLRRTGVRDRLLDILTENMLDFFSGLHVDDRQQIQNAYKNKPQRRAAEVFLNKITRLSNDEWHRELIGALANSGAIGYCQYLWEEYQKCFVDRQATERPNDGPVFCPPKPKRLKKEDTRITHLKIWSDVVQKKIVNLCQILNAENLLKVLENCIPEFVRQKQSEFQAEKDLGDNRACRWLLEKLSNCGDPSWPGALAAAIKGTPLEETINETFWDIHSQKKYSSCHGCEQEKKQEATEGSLDEGASSST